MDDNQYFTEQDRTKAQINTNSLVEFYTSINLQLENQRRVIDEIRLSQNKVAAALLGSFEQNVPGLIEDTRNIHKELDALKPKVETHEKTINSLIIFKNDTKKVVAGIALAVPFLFEVLKGVVYFIWEHIKAAR
jgi:hypothetical protein